MIYLVRGISAFMLGRWSLSRSALEHAETLFRNHCTGVTWERDTVTSLALWALMHMGRIAELKSRWTAFIKEAQERGDLYAATTLTTFYLAIIRLADDDPSEVEDELSGVMRRWSRRGFSLQHSSAFRSLMHLDLYRGRVDAAWDRVKSVWPEYSRSMLLRIQLIRIHMLELRARSALAVAEQGKLPNLAARSARQDARRLEREGQGWAMAHAHYVRAGIAACLEDAAEGTAPLPARRRAVRLGGHAAPRLGHAVPDGRDPGGRGGPRTDPRSRGLDEVAVDPLSGTLGRDVRAGILEDLERPHHDDVLNVSGWSEALTSPRSTRKLFIGSPPPSGVPSPSAARQRRPGTSQARQANPRNPRERP